MNGIFLHIVITNVINVVLRSIQGDQSNLDIIRYLLIDNPDYVDNACSLNNKLEKTFVRLHSFDLNNPVGGTGDLYNARDIVIPDSSISINISYPLMRPVDVTIQTQEIGGFTLTDLVFSIKLLYQYIYDEEERTSSSRSYEIQKSCSTCIGKSMTEYIEEKDVETPGSECSICYTDYTANNPGKLGCGHIFHTKCILKWMETSVKCPLCRATVSDCDECDGSKIIKYSYNGAVIPMEHRGIILNRNNTDGIFGIFGHDFEDLILEHMHYDRIQKILTVHVGS